MFVPIDDVCVIVNDSTLRSHAFRTFRHRERIGWRRWLIDPFRRLSWRCCMVVDFRCRDKCRANRFERWFAASVAVGDRAKPTLHLVRVLKS
jgi:hypothetical protein